MTSIKHSILAAAVLGILAPGSATCAADAYGVETIKPIAGQGAQSNGHFLHNEKLGSKQTIGYFINDTGLCNLTLMIGEAFNGEDVPDMTTVRFESQVGPGRTLIFTTAEGGALEFRCLENAVAMTIRALDQVAAKASAM